MWVKTGNFEQTLAANTTRQRVQYETDEGRVKSVALVGYGDQLRFRICTRTLPDAVRLRNHHLSHYQLSNTLENTPSLNIIPIDISGITRSEFQYLLEVVTTALAPSLAQITEALVQQLPTWHIVHDTLPRYLSLSIAAPIVSSLSYQHTDHLKQHANTPHSPVEGIVLDGYQSGDISLEIHIDHIHSESGIALLHHLIPIIPAALRTESWGRDYITFAIHISALTSDKTQAVIRTLQAYCNIAALGDDFLHVFSGTLQATIAAQPAEAATPAPLFLRWRRDSRQEARLTPTTTDTAPGIPSYGLPAPTGGNPLVTFPHRFLQLQLLAEREGNITRSATPPDEGENARKLKAIGYEEEIPENYLCALSYNILSNPVYDPQHPQYKFERKWIELALERAPENPFTRTLLEKENLVSDDALKAEITLYVNDLVASRHRAAPSNS